ncbi:MAG: class I SAM-dependent methyltransferase [Bauldia sp.]|nr:class I SAM-dependent methyltransferase [Bauldia sp.]
MEEFFAANRARWDELVGLHLRDTTGVYPLDELRAGGDLLCPIEASEIGDIAGKKVVHLQCHFGADTICLARRGATVTGLDFSPRAVATARALAAELGVDATFVEGNVFDAPALVGTGFDMVYVTWGALGWLPYVRRWAKAVADCLRPGGVLYLAEGHPFMFMLEEREGRFEIDYEWRTPPERPILEIAPVSYAGDGTPVANERAFGWNHPFSEIIGGLLEAGMALQYLHEHEMIPWRAFPSMVPQGRMYVQAEGQKKMPLAFSLKAVKGGPAADPRA